MPRGYALVAVDVRGTGASFGTRDSFRSPRERDDHSRIAEWVAAQPWWMAGSGGPASPMSARPAISSLAGQPGGERDRTAVGGVGHLHRPLLPGGLLLNRLAQTYDALMVALDHDRRDLLGEFAYFKDPNLAGPAPVDDDPEGEARDAAVRQHIANFRMPAFIAEFRYHDDALPYDPAFTPASFSPCITPPGPRRCRGLSVSGWMDGAGYQNGAIARFLTLPNRNKHLLLGPLGPWRAHQWCRPGAGPRSRIFLDGELLRFFDTYLMERETGLSREAPVHYFAMHGESWREAPEWPPAANTRRLFLAEGAALSLSPGSGADEVTTDFGFGSGTHTRYGRLAAHDTRTYYDDWQAREVRLPCYRSEPLDGDIELAGHAVLTLRLAPPSRWGAARVPVRGGAQRHCALRDRGRVAGAASQAVGARRIIAQAGRITAAIAPTRRRWCLADRKTSSSRCCRPPGVSARAAGSGWQSRRRRRPLRPGAARPPAGVHDQPGGLVS